MQQLLILYVNKMLIVWSCTCCFLPVLIESHVHDIHKNMYKTCHRLYTCIQIRNISMILHDSRITVTRALRRLLQRSHAGDQGYSIKALLLTQSQQRFLCANSVIFWGAVWGNSSRLLGKLPNYRKQLPLKLMNFRQFSVEVEVIGISNRFRMIP